VFINKNTEFGLILCSGVGKGRSRKVSDVVKRTNMGSDVNFQMKSLKATADIIGRERFVHISKNKGSPDVSGKDIEDMKAAVMRVYELA
jgi:hypothetical protein